MIFKSIFNLVDTNKDGVYKFLCKVLDESNVDPGIEEYLFVFAALEKFSKCDVLDFQHFISFFDQKRIMLKVFEEFGKFGKLHCFADETEVQLSSLDKFSISMIPFYIDLIGIGNVKNIDKKFKNTNDGL